MLAATLQFDSRKRIAAMDAIESPCFDARGDWVCLCGEQTDACRGFDFAQGKIGNADIAMATVAVAAVLPNTGGYSPDSRKVS